MVNLKDIFTNPANPRIIRDDKYKKLVKSIDEFPKMMELRPIIVDSEGMILGGNMRYKALKELGYKEVPETWIKMANDLTEDEIRRFTIADNVGFGEWDYELLANEWDVQELEDWGVDLPGFAIMPNDDELTADFQNKPPTLKITFVSPKQLQSAEIDIQEILDRKYKGAFFSVSAGEL